VTAILVIEDDPEVCDLLGEVLEVHLGAVVRRASTGTLGAEAIETAGFDLAIIDMGLPGISGFELAKRAADKNIPALLCTGHPDALATLKAHGCPHLAKPFKPEELVYQAAKIITRTAETIYLLKASLARLQATAESLQASLAESRRLVAETKALLARDRPSAADFAKIASASGIVASKVQSAHARRATISQDVVGQWLSELGKPISKSFVK
jgi:DNA-binding response OmpR family regulator